MTTYFATMQTSCLIMRSHSFSRHQKTWRCGSTLPSAKPTVVESFCWSRNVLQISTSYSRLSVCAAKQRDLELAEEELGLEKTPLETFFDRHCSLFESLEAPRIRSVIDAASIKPENASPSILVMLGSEAFVNQLFNTFPDGYIEVTHFSTGILADIKERLDDVRCFYITTTDFSEISGSFDAIFLNYFPIFSNSMSKLLKDAARFCKPGGIVVLSLAQDKRCLVSLKDQSGGLVRSELPDEQELSKMVSALPLELVNFEDSANFYLATLKVKEVHTKGQKTGIKNSTLRKGSEFPLYVSGEVVHGFGRGSKKLGFPTANLSLESLPPEIAKLQKGVYYGCAQIIGAGFDSDVYRMVMNIGIRPTFVDKDDTISLEVHILHDYGSDFYGKEMRVAIMGFIRKESRFSSVDDLIKRINEDIEEMQARLPNVDFEACRTNSFFTS